MDRKIVASGIREALENADIEFRYQLPDVFKKVDRLLGNPNRHRVPWRDVEITDAMFKVAECGWCGDPFAASHYRGTWTECCSTLCARRLRKFRKRRAS